MEKESGIAINHIHRLTKFGLKNSFNTVPKFDFSGNIFFNLDKNVTSSLDKLIDIKSEKHKVSKSGRKMIFPMSVVMLSILNLDFGQFA